jgi:hypothetical protein
VSILLTGIAQLATQSGQLGEIDDGALVIDGASIAWVGRAADAPTQTRGFTSVDVPCFPASSTRTHTSSSPASAARSSLRE